MRRPETPLVLLLTLFGLVAAQRLYENEPCRREPGWTCRKFSQCLWAQAEIRKGRNPQICSFQGTEPLVCCPQQQPQQPQRTTQAPAATTTATRRPTARPPSVAATTARPSTQQPAGTKSRAMCKKWSDLVVQRETPIAIMPWDDPELTIKNDQCGQLDEPLIVGGEVVKGKEYPHMASVGYKDNPIRWLCGCSIISERFVLTAAHCSDGGARWGPAKWVRVGELDFDSEVDDAKPVNMAIKRTINHPGYTAAVNYNDIALFELQREITFNAFVRPACLHTTWDIPDRSAVATGWGHVEYGGKQSSALLKVRLNLVPTETCQERYGSATKIPQGINNVTQLCAGDKDGKDTCQGDSGGPLQTPVRDPYCMYNVVGVTSFGKGCGTSTPAVYTRVSYFVPWIEEIVWP